MGTNCATLVADLFLFCYENDFMKSLSKKNQTEIIEDFNLMCKTMAHKLIFKFEIN